MAIHVMLSILSALYYATWRQVYVVVNHALYFVVNLIVNHAQTCKLVQVLLKAESMAGQKGKEVKPFDSESIG